MAWSLGFRVQGLGLLEGRSQNSMPRVMKVAAHDCLKS